VREAASSRAAISAPTSIEDTKTLQEQHFNTKSCKMRISKLKASIAFIILELLFVKANVKFY
jgi:hypothetical protein